MSKLHLFLVTYLGLHSLALPVFGSFRYLTLASDEDSLSEIALSDASKIASTYFSLFYRNVHVLYTGIDSISKTGSGGSAVWTELSSWLFITH